MYKSYIKFKMANIPKIDLLKRYTDRIMRQPTGGLVSLLEGLKGIKDPFLFRENLYCIAQLYNDGITNKEDEGKGWEEQEKVLRDIHKAGITATGQFYSGEGIDVEQARKLILPNASEIIRYGSTKPAKQRHLFSDIEATQRFALEFQNRQKEIGNIDSVVAVASGGFEPAYLLAHILGIEEIAGVRYSGWARDDEARIPREAPRNYLERFCREKDVAVVEDVIWSGESIREVIKSVMKNNPKRVVGFSVMGNSERGIIYPTSRYESQTHSINYPAIFEIKPRRKK